MITKIAKFITSTSLLLAIDAPLIIIFGYLLYGTELNFTILVAASLAVFAIYNLNKVTDKKEDTINRPETASKPKIFYVAPSIAALTLSIVLGATISLTALAILITPIIIGMLYSIKISPKLPRLKEITGVKSLMVALSWSIYGAFLPLALQPTSLSAIILVFSFVFIQVFINTVIFDFLDMKGDMASGTKTLPLTLGKGGTKKLLFLFNSAMAVWVAICFFGGLFVRFMPALVFSVAYGYFIIWHFSKEYQKRLNAELMVDGEWLPILTIMGISLL